VADWGKWLAWDGKRWQRDKTLAVFDRARTICHETVPHLECNASTASRLASGSTVAAVEKLARYDRQHAATVEQWDSDEWLLNTQSGVVNLKTGSIGPHKQADHMTKITAAKFGGDCPMWKSFLVRVTGEDEELQGFLKRMCGYALTGSTREQALFFLWGSGKNGKSTFINTISGILGDYATTAPMETFIASNRDHHPTDLAGLQGARLVTSIETEKGRRWAESKLKNITGGDPISARFMRQDFFQFVPKFKLVIAGNYKPGLNTVDEAMRRRLNLVPFTVTIPEEERVLDFDKKLEAEWPGILSWMIDGCLEWQRGGLKPPNSVRAATEEYLEGEDILGQWINEQCVRGESCEAYSNPLFTNWKNWCDQNQEWAGSHKEFSQMLENKGFHKKHLHSGNKFFGITCRASDG
jgi:putative DNA primase/helicase